MKNHKFGLIIFAPIEVIDAAHEAGRVCTIKGPDSYDPEDPFCYECGQKQMNADPVCPGREDSYSRNVQLPDLLEKY